MRGGLSWGGYILLSQWIWNLAWLRGGIFYFTISVHLKSGLIKAGVALYEGATVCVVYLNILVSLTNKTDCHNITEILLKVVLNTNNAKWVIYYMFYDTVPTCNDCNLCSYTSMISDELASFNSKEILHTVHTWTVSLIWSLNWLNTWYISTYCQKMASVLRANQTRWNGQLFALVSMNSPYFSSLCEVLVTLSVFRSQYFFTNNHTFSSIYTDKEVR